MAVSAKMLAVLQKVDAAREQYFIDLRAKGVEDRAREAEAKVALAAKRRAALALWKDSKRRKGTA